MSTSMEHAFAIVESVETDGLRLKFDGEDTAGEKTYKCNTFFKFAAGDRVYCVKDSGTFVAICKIGAPATQIVADDANVTYVPLAGNATNATNADNATEAERVKLYADTLYQIMFKAGTGNSDILYTKMYDGMVGTMYWFPLGAARDEAVTYTTDTAIVRFRSAGDGKLQFLLPYRNSYTWYTIATE